MRVRTYDCATPGEEYYRGESELIDCLPDDDERARARNELERSGRYWVGGGAAPLVLLMKAD